MSKNTRFALQIWPFVLSLALLFAAQQLEDRFFPVVKDFKVLQIQQIGREITLSGYLKKVRNCEVLGVVATVDDHGRPVQIQIATLNPMDVSTRVLPIGSNNWGPWRISLPQAAKGAEIVIRSLHSCHPAWATTTRLADFPVPEGVLQ